MSTTKSSAAQRRCAPSSPLLPHHQLLTTPPASLTLQLSVPCDELTERYIAEFHADIAALRCLPPNLEPRATAHVPDIVALIQRIIANGHAYALAGGDVYFEVASLPGYGRLSRRGDEDNRAGERVAVDDRKRGAADFALWKVRLRGERLLWHAQPLKETFLCVLQSAKPGEPSWESPWGPGRPGWHIECSAMIEALMGPIIDIHGGGADLVFPHHENELAQSAVRSQLVRPLACCPDACRHHQAACGCGVPHGAAPPPSFARFWVHNGFVNVDAEKMSKCVRCCHAAMRRATLRRTAACICSGRWAIFSQSARCLLATRPRRCA